MKIRITTNEKDQPQTVSEVTTDLPFDQFLLKDFGVYETIEELKSDWDKAEVTKTKAVFNNPDYNHAFEVIG